MPSSSRLSLAALGGLALALTAWWIGTDRGATDRALTGPEEGPAPSAGTPPPVEGGARVALPVDGPPSGPATGPAPADTPSAGAEAPATAPDRRAALERQYRLHAGRMATRLGLASGAEEQIVAVLLEGLDRADAALARHASGARTPEDRAALRAALDEVPRWQHRRFVELFGEEAARGILEHDDRAAAREEGIPLIEDGD
jgi:hypothetical protein